MRLNAVRPKSMFSKLPRIHPCSCLNRQLVGKWGSLPFAKFIAAANAANGRQRRLSMINARFLELDYEDRVQFVAFQIIGQPNLARPEFVKADCTNAVVHVAVGIWQLGVNDDPEETRHVRP